MSTQVEQAEEWQYVKNAFPGLVTRFLDGVETLDRDYFPLCDHGLSRCSDRLRLSSAAFKIELANAVNELLRL